LRDCIYHSIQLIEKEYTEKTGFEDVQNEETESSKRERLFNGMYDSMTSKNDGDFIEYQGEFPKEEFLDFLVHEKGFLLRGTNNSTIQELEPRQANCASKKFGNMCGVYAVEDSVLPIFYSIKDKDLFNGIAESGVGEIPSEEGPQKKYHFAVSREALESNLWSEGAVYILPRETFKQGGDDDGGLIDEWASEVTVKPVAKLKISPNDFRFLDEIQPLD